MIAEVMPYFNVQLTMWFQDQLQMLQGSWQQFYQQYFHEEIQELKQTVDILRSAMETKDAGGQQGTNDADGKHETQDAVGQQETKDADDQ